MCTLTDTCHEGLTCASGRCVALNNGTGGVSGLGGSPATGGSPGGAGDTGSGGEDGSGGDQSSGGNDGSGGDEGTGGVGTGGVGTGGMGTGGMGMGTGGMGTGGSVGDTCNGAGAHVIDNFTTCDDNICQVGGRTGTWFSYADVGINLDFDVRVPPTAWSYGSCAAVTIGGPLASGSKTYAGAGVILNNGNPYNASGYTGVRITLESGAPVWVAIVQANGGRYGAFAPASNVQVRDIPFSAMTAQDDSTGVKDTSQIIEIHFNPEDPSAGFGFLVAQLSFY